MAKQTANGKSTKVVQIIARYFIKRNGAVVYLVKSSNGQDTYTTTIVNGKATGCTCPATKPCYHMVQLQEKEAARTEAAAVAGDKSFADVMDSQYANDPRESLKEREERETAQAYSRMFYAEY